MVTEYMEEDGSGAKVGQRSVFGDVGATDVTVEELAARVGEDVIHQLHHAVNPLNPTT
jgi:hypothetical protein